MLKGTRGPLIVSVNLTVAARDMLKALAAHRGMTMATAAESVIRRALDEHLATLKPTAVKR